MSLSSILAVLDFPESLSLLENSMSCSFGGKKKIYGWLIFLIVFIVFFSCIIILPSPLFCVCSIYFVFLLMPLGGGWPSHSHFLNTRLQAPGSSSTTPPITRYCLSLCLSVFTPSLSTSPFKSFVVFHLPHFQTNASKSNPHHPWGISITFFFLDFLFSVS